MDSRPPVVITLHSDMAGDITDPVAIARAFVDFFWEVDRSKVQYPPQKLLNLLETLDLPKLTAEQVP